MCDGVVEYGPPQDILSQWRAYAQDGRGGVISLDMARLTGIVGHVPGLRINPVAYDPALKRTLVDGVLAEGHKRYSVGVPTAVSDTVDALIFCVPLMKHTGFSEEKEWRLIYVPPITMLPTIIQFHSRRDFLTPFLDIKDLCTAPAPTLKPLIPITEVMVGPSAHQGLNIKAMLRKVVARFRPGLAVNSSQIPYRSLA